MASNPDEIDLTGDSTTESLAYSPASPPSSRRAIPAIRGSTNSSQPLPYSPASPPGSSRAIHPFPGTSSFGGLPYSPASPTQSSHGIAALSGTSVPNHLAFSPASPPGSSRAIPPVHGASSIDGLAYSPASPTRSTHGVASLAGTSVPNALPFSPASPSASSRAFAPLPSAGSPSRPKRASKNAVAGPSRAGNTGFGLRKGARGISLEEEEEDEEEEGIFKNAIAGPSKPGSTGMGLRKRGGGAAAGGEMSGSPLKKRTTTTRSAIAAGKVEGVTLEYLPIGLIFQLNNVTEIADYESECIPKIQNGEYVRSVTFVAQTRNLLVEVERVEMIANGRKGFEFKKREGLRTLVMKVARYCENRMASSLWTEWKVGKDICDEIASMASRELLETDSTTAEISTFKENTSSSDRHAQNPTADNTAKMAASSIALPHLPLFVFGDLDYCEEEEAKKRRAGGEGWKRDVFQFALCEKGIVLTEALSRADLSPERARTLLSSALDSISVLHSTNHIHRDIKPENMVIKVVYSDDGVEMETDEVKLIDLGCAVTEGSRWEDDSGKIVRVGEGTAKYLSIDCLMSWIKGDFQYARSQGCFDEWTEKQVDSMETLLRSSSRSEMTCYPDIWALGISMLTYLDPGYVNANCLNQDHLLSFRAAFGYRDGVFGKADSWDTVWQAVENVAEFYSPLFHEKTFYSDEGGRVDRAVWSGLLNTLLVVPQVRSPLKSTRTIDNKYSSRLQSRFPTTTKALTEAPAQNSIGSAAASLYTVPSSSASASGSNVRKKVGTAASLLEKRSTQSSTPALASGGSGGGLEGKTGGRPQDLQAVYGELVDGYLVYRFLPSKPGHKTSRNLICALEGCCKTDGMGPWVANKGDFLAKFKVHLAHQLDATSTGNKWRCAYFNGVGALAEVGIRILRDDGSVEVEWDGKGFAKE